MSGQRQDEARMKEHKRACCVFIRQGHGCITNRRAADVVKKQGEGDCLDSDLFAPTSQWAVVIKCSGRGICLPST